jgi:hypothetical protein
MRNCTTTDTSRHADTFQQRALWFIGLWFSGVAAAGLVALIFHLLLPGG